MLEKIPTKEEMVAIGQQLFEVRIEICDLIESKYDMERLWYSGEKNGGMSINIAKAGNHYALYTLKKTCLLYDYLW